MSSSRTVTTPSSVEPEDLGRGLFTEAEAVAAALVHVDVHHAASIGVGPARGYG
jgi:hypothetical protein